MASKFGLAGGIPEYRVRPILAIIESRQYKAALKLCTSLLAKHPTSPYALALKALIMERMGKPDEALSVCLNAMELLCSDNIVHLDDLTLSTLQIVFQRLERLDLATSCYEYACRKYPNNLELMMGLFNCHVREYSYVKQQQTAIRMYRTVEEDRFLLWAVCSIQLQVYFTSGGEKLLALAEALLKKHINSHSLHEPEALVLYISILEQQAKYDAALEVLSGDLGSLMRREEDKLRLQGRLLAQACNYVPASEVYQKVLESCPDDWDSFLRYLGCLLEYDVNLPKPSTGEHTCSSCSVDSTQSNKTSLSEELVESRLARALSFVQKLQENVSGDCVRGPHLANIEIERQHRLNGKTTGRKFIEALVNYFHRFGHLSSSSSDVEIYLHMLSDDEVTELLDTISRSTDATSVSVKALGLTITTFKIQELLGTLLAKSTTDLQCIAKGMVETFCKNLPLSRDLDPQESMHGEELLSMASSILVQLFWRTRNLGYLLEAILVLEFGLTVRKHVWQYKITLVHLYSFLGALPLASRWYVSLEVKNILLESFLHHILPQMLSSPFLQQTADLVKDYLRFMDDHLKESADLTCLAYKHRAYSKVIEFVQFKNRLQRSMQYLSVQSDSVILSLKQKAQSLEEVESILESVHNGERLIDLSKEDNMKQLTFDEDLEARPWWTPTTSVNFLSEQNNQASTPACFRAKVCKHKSTEKDGPKLGDTKRKSLVPRLVYLSIESSIYPLSRAGKLWLEKYARSLGYSIDDALGVILDMSSGKKPIKDFTPDIVSWMSFAVFINAMNLWSSESVIPRTDQSSPSSWQILDTLVKICIEEQLTDANRILTCPGNNIPVLVQMITEPISWHLIVIQSHMRAMAPQGKKKKGGPSERPNMPHLQAIQRSVQCLIDTLRSIQTWLSDQMSPEEQALDILLSNLQGPSDEGPGQIFHVLEENSAAHDSEVGGRIAQSLHRWSCTDLVRRIVGAEHELLAELKKICESKLKLLMSELAVIPVDGPRAGATLDEKNRDRKKAEDAKTREKEKQKKRESQERDTVLKEFIDKAEYEMCSKLQKVAEDAEKDFCDKLNMVEKEAHNEISAKLERGIQDAKNEVDARVQKETEKAEQEMLAKIRELEMEAQEEMVDKIDKAKKKAEKKKMDKLKKARKRAEHERDGKILRAKAELETNNTISEKTENEGRKERKEEDPKTENDAEQDTEFRNADAIDSKNGISVVEDANIKAGGNMDDSSPPTNGWARKPRICSEVSIDPEIIKNQNNGVMLRAFLNGYSEEGADMKYYPSLVAIMKLQSSTIFTIDFKHILSKQEYKNLSISLVQGAEQPWVKETIAQFFLDKKYHISPTVKFKNNPDRIWSFHEFVGNNKCYQRTATCPDQIAEATFHGKMCLSMLINAVVDKHRLNLCFNGQMDLEDLLVLDYVDTKKLMIFTETYQTTHKGCKADMAKIWSLCESYYVLKGELSMLPLDFIILEHDLLSVSESAVRTWGYRMYICHHPTLSSSSATRNFSNSLHRIIKQQGIRRADAFLNVMPRGLWCEWEMPQEPYIDWRSSMLVLKAQNKVLAGIYDYQAAIEGIDLENNEDGEYPFDPNVVGMLSMRRNLSEHGYNYTDQKDTRTIKLFANSNFKGLVAFLLKKILDLNEENRIKYTALLNSYFASFGVEE